MCLICVHNLLTYTFKLHVRFDKSLQLLIVTSLSFQWTKTLSMTSFNYDKEVVFGKRWDLPRRWLTINPIYTYRHRKTLGHILYFHMCLLDRNVLIRIDIMMPKQDRLQYADDIFKCVLLQKDVSILIQSLRKFALKGRIDNNQHWFECCCLTATIRYMYIRWQRPTTLYTVPGPQWVSLCSFHVGRLLALVQPAVWISALKSHCSTMYNEIQWLIVYQQGVHNLF